MNPLDSRIEALLFLSVRPVSFKKIAQTFEVKETDVREAVERLAATRNTEASGIHLIIANNAVELGTNPAFADVLSAFSKEEVESELTRPQLETLTIIAYRGPITKPEIEHIRGVNCALILRNLLMRGLVIEKDDETRLQPVYSISSEMLRHLGLHDVAELPDYGDFNKNEKISKMLEALFTESTEEESV